MSLIFYYAPMSTASISQLVMEELGIPCEKVKLDLKKGETHNPEYLKINPNGKVPCIVHDGTAIWESAAITMYLGEMFGIDKKLYPLPGPKRGEAMRWIAWANVTLAEAAGRFGRNTMAWYPAEQHNAKAGEAAKKDIENCFQILDQHLDGRQFLVGEYTLADTHLNSVVDWIRFMKVVDVASYGQLKAWSDRCSARPAYARVMAENH